MQCMFKEFLSILYIYFLIHSSICRKCQDPNASDCQAWTKFQSLRGAHVTLTTYSQSINPKGFIRVPIISYSEQLQVVDRIDPIMNFFKWAWHKVKLVCYWSDRRFILFGGKLRINTLGVKRFYENWKICSSISGAPPAPLLLTEIWGRGFQQNLIKLSFMVFRSIRRCFVFLVKLCLACRPISFWKATKL